jgi:Spy/CpxP family protein refolding chaperone
MKKILFSFLLIVVFAVPAFAQMGGMPMMGQGRGHGPMMGMGDMDMMGGDMMCMEHARHMGLTDEQMEKIKPLRREMQKKHIRFKADQKIAELELEEIMDVKDFDLEKAKSAVKKIGDMKTAHHLEMLKAKKEMRSILTDEQFKKMCKMMPMKMGAKKKLRKRIHKPAPQNPNPQQPTADPKPKAQTDDTVHKH